MELDFSSLSSLLLPFFLHAMESKRKCFSVFHTLFASSYYRIRKIVSPLSAKKKSTRKLNTRMMTYSSFNVFLYSSALSHSCLKAKHKSLFQRILKSQTQILEMRKIFFRHFVFRCALNFPQIHFPFVYFTYINESF
jgi:hypothetical protein